MKKKVLLLVGAATLLAFQACQESTVLNGIEKNTNDSSAQIEFSNFVTGMTRASRATGSGDKSFQDGDCMEVYGFQTIDNTETTLLFNKQLVTNNQGWSYTPVKYWEKNSKYDFYAIFPYSANNSFDTVDRLFSISSFTVQDTARDQVDVMIAKQITDHRPYNVVPFEFCHALSNVNFYIKTDGAFNTYGITSLKVTSFDVTGLYSEGSFAQGDWDNGNVFTGQWTPDVTSEYDLPEVKDSVYVVGSPKAKTIVDDLLLLPQQINDNAKVSIKFQLLYEDGSIAAFTRTVALNKVVGKKATEPTQNIVLAKWDPNYIYNYTISVNPAITEQGGQHLPIGNADHSQDQFENQDPDNPIVPNINIIQIDTDGDGVPDEWWVDQDLDDIIDTINNVDYPIIWKDIDNDGKEEALPDRDKDGQPDYTNGTNDPDVIWIDTDNDGVVDTELEREKTKPSDPELPDNPTDPTYPDTAYVDYDGAATGGYKQPTSWLVTDADGEYWIDTDNDGQGDIKVVWKNIDDDDLLEGIADKDGDGKATEADNYDGDHKDYLGNDNEYDVIQFAHVIKTEGAPDDYEKDAYGNIIWHELEKEAPEEPEIPEVTTEIQFSAEVAPWIDAYDAEYIINE